MVLRSPFPDVVVPDVPLHELLFAELGAHARHTALVDGATGRSISYGELAEMVDRVAAALAARGVGRGDVVAVLGPNIPHYAVVLHGVLRAGATATTINALYTAEEIAGQLADSGARLVFTVSPFLERVTAAADSTGVREIVLMDSADPDPDPDPDPASDRAAGDADTARAAGHTPLSDLLAHDGPPPDVVIDPATDVAVLPYSSGTTGRAKGVRLTHRNLVANLVQCQAVIPVTDRTRVLAVLPFFHIYGMQVTMNHALYNRGTVVTLPRFDLAEFLRVIAEHRTDRVYVAPPVVVALAKHPAVADADLSALEVLFSGAAPLDAELAASVRARLGCRVRQGYGMTELSPVSHAIPGDRDDIPPGTVGLMLPNMTAKLVDPATGEEVGPGVPGELLLRGPNVMAGYLNDEAATEAAFDDEGFLRTGDVAVVDGQGCFSIVDRVKELIKYKGYQVPPAELEALLLTHPGIADAAVVGVPDPEGGEAPKAFVVRQAGAGELTAEDIMAYVAARVAPHKKVRAVAFVDAVPKSPSGKILRRALRAGEEAAAAS
ncbi:4-coumarate--CoA ligase [Streptoalloteichus tenebrarius]|uniref:4-coumarate--CoA ligase n=1 Tax=Streptoalloteichus tenebrarius (strain ATCC 17920 / DSM 40477 / JCM 4838 / CBS 697.72 / NBRC 16177 / NCIMB 11028 / NRRL B-12390 / A12253. 1 / ISP 5477) TaxID=1933 RepID=A0ABT1I1T6_STRSD|nr:AMP-binding protein [Streptoalloteichus tenebrarius]MCP2261701.1 4-coumarate--CoA ligase [Streptoalloteichus tenebrarius]BFF02412.1 AMP-binding protein [Streptoalloteichus tenebrarius]